MSGGISTRRGGGGGGAARAAGSSSIGTAMENSALFVAPAFIGAGSDTRFSEISPHHDEYEKENLIGVAGGLAPNSLAGSPAEVLAGAAVPNAKGALVVQERRNWSRSRRK